LINGTGAFAAPGPSIVSWTGYGLGKTRFAGLALNSVCPEIRDFKPADKGDDKQSW
jgi:hypothetical protein